MLLGEFHHTIDEKGRLIVPSKLRVELGEKFVITRGLEECLFAYSLTEWEEIVKKLNTLPFTKQDARNFSRFFMSGATTVEFDKQGRINLSCSLMTYANLKKDCVIVGVGNRLEIWSETAWNNFFVENKNQMSAIAENLFSNIDL